MLFRSVTSTVDINRSKKELVFDGKSLKVFAINPLDLIKMKLERFYKQDPEDIYNIIENMSLKYEDFKKLALEGYSDFVGRKEDYFLSAQIVVEKVYPQHLENFLSSKK